MGEPPWGHSERMTDETHERDEEREAEEHPLESPESVRQPRAELDEEWDRGLQPGVTPDLNDR